MSYFEYAAKNKLRFSVGNMTVAVEDLYDLPLQHATKANLDSLAVSLSKQLKDTAGSESFVKPASTKANEALEVSFEIVKHIIGVKVAERDERQNQQIKAEQRQVLLGLLTSKKQEALGALSVEELQKQLDAL
jgi:hypothetical protein